MASEAIRNENATRICITDPAPSIRQTACGLNREVALSELSSKRLEFTTFFYNSIITTVNFHFIV